MPRQARKKSGSGIYHIMLRGINRQIIFEDEEDSEVFLETMGLYKAEFNCLIYGYCLMKNHAHLLMKIDNDEIHNFMRKLGAKYVYWYNWKYDRVGGLFQDRYKSEPVEDDGYFLTVLRYIHQNPVKAGLCESVAEYEESSYNEYINLKSGQLTDADFALSIIGKTQFIEFNNEIKSDRCLEVREIARVNDNEAKMIIYEISNCKNSAEFQALPEDMRNICLRELKAKGLSIRQIERLTGINRGVVLKM
ncbi:MAG: transposase [Clostridiales bacterium]|nr:transposase [Clostridiales bacterium]